MNPKYITLISYGHFEKDFLTNIAASITHEYILPVNIIESYIDLSEFYDPARRQYDGNKLLKEINSNTTTDSLKTVGLFAVDLFIPILTYIYGQAFLCGHTGIASLYRLKNELYGMKQDEKLLLNRFKKVITHELGHTFGLKHCHSSGCVMKSSTYVEDIDQKSANLCPRCKTEIKST
jgi:archaemetzincin